MKLYSFKGPTFNVTKPLLTAYELGLPIELVPLDPVKGEHKLPEHLARHPLGKVPALEHDGRVLFESMAIVRYLLSLGPHSLHGDYVAITDQWCEYILQHPASAVGVFFWQEVVRARMNGLEPDAKAIERATRQLTTELKPLDDRLTQVPWLSGNVYGVADIVAASYVWTLAPLSYDLGRWQGLSNWWSRVERRPAFQSVASLYAA